MTNLRNKRYAYDDKFHVQENLPFMLVKHDHSY